MLLFRLLNVRFRLGGFGILPGKATYLVSIILQGIGKLAESLTSAFPERCRRESVLLAVRRKATCLAPPVRTEVLFRPADPESERPGCKRFVAFSASGCAAWRRAVLS